VPRAVEAIGGGALLDHLTIGRLGWVDQARVSEMYRRARRLVDSQDEEYCPLMFRLWMIAGVELWYRSAFVEGTRDGRAQGAEAGEAWCGEDGPAAPRLSTAAVR
jgi:hypothetical protein